VTSRPQNKQGFFIGAGCPGCGGDLELESDFFVLECPHCGSNLRVKLPDSPVAYMVQSKVESSRLRFYADRYLKENDLPLTGSGLQTKMLYFPYWRVDATLLKLRNKTNKRVIYSETDSSQESVSYTDKTTISVNPYSVTIGAGTPTEGVPETLGMRSEIVRVVPFADENIEDDFSPLPIVRPFEVIEKKIKLAVYSMSQINPADFGQNITRMFNPVFSLIYFPYVIAESYDPAYRRFVLDGLTGRVLKLKTPGEERNETGQIVRENGLELKLGAADVSIQAGSSPEPSDSGIVGAALSRGVVTDSMGANLDDSGGYEQPLAIEFGQLDVGFHRCANCGVDLPAQKSYVYICSNCQVIQLAEETARELNGIEVADWSGDDDVVMVPFWWIRISPEESKRMARMLGTVQQPDKLFIPALKASNFEAANRLARRMTAAHTKLTTSRTSMLDSRFMPVAISQSEARAHAELLICREMMEMGNRSPEVEVDLKATESGLIYVPFQLQNYFYVDAILKAVTMERSLID